MSEILDSKKTLSSNKGINRSIRPQKSPVISSVGENRNKNPSSNPSPITRQTSVNLGSNLIKNGYELVLEPDIPLTNNEWSRLELLTEQKNLAYTQPEMGDTKEELSLNVFRIKIAGDNKIYHEELMSLVASPKMLDFYRKICGNSKLIIDRCQAHLYKENDFIARHVDRESYQAYLYSLLFSVSHQFTGGEMVVYSNQGTTKFKIPMHAILFGDSAVPHEVLPIKSGIRKTIALFLMEPEKV